MATPSRTCQDEHRECADAAASIQCSGLLHSALSFLERQQPIKLDRVVAVSLMGGLLLSGVLAIQDNATGQLQTGTGILMLGAKIVTLLAVFLTLSSLAAHLITWLRRDK